MYKQALEYKAKEDWNNYLICLLESDEIEANKELHLFYRVTKWYSKTNLTHILPTIQKLIDKNNNEAQYLLGYMYHYGIIVKENYEKAIHYYTLSANQGHSSGQNNLGYMYHYGLGIEQNYEKAIYYYTLSANQDNYYAQYNLEHIPKIELVKYELKQKNIEIEEFKKKIEELETHIRAMPDGELYFEAQEHYKDQLSKKGEKA